MPHPFASTTHNIKLMRISTRILAASVLFTGSLLFSTQAGAEQTTDQRLSKLEGQVQSLTRRLALLERRTATAEPRDDAEPADGIVWTIGPDLDGGAFSVSQKTLDKNRGEVDLLLRINAPIEHPARWSEPGKEVPITLTLRTAAGIEKHTRFKLARATRLEPGAHLHIRADIDPAMAAAVRQMIIGLAAD